MKISLHSSSLSATCSATRRHGTRCVLLSVVLVANTLLATGCALHRYEPQGRLVDSELQKRYHSWLHDRYPESCMLIQRILIRTGGNDFDMTGYLLLRPDGSWLAVALGDMGMELFRLSFDGRKTEVIKRPDSVPLGPLIGGIASDIQHLLGVRTGTRAYLVRRTDSIIGLAVEHSDGALDEYQFTQGGDSLSRSLGVSDGRIVREVSYTEPTRYDDRTILLPRRALLHNYRWHYSMEVLLLEMRVMPAQGKDNHSGAMR